MKPRAEAGHGVLAVRTLRAVAIVPARLGSTRLPRKMLLRETGRYLFEHTVRGVRRSRLLERVVLATDSAEILEAAREVEIEAVLTAESHPSGTDRVHEACQILLGHGQGPWDVVLNVQGDEPEIRGEALDPLILAFTDPGVQLATLCTPLVDPRAALDPSVVKVVTDRNGDALYFSRAPVPGTAPGASAHRGDPRGDAGGTFRRHLGVYAFRPQALREFCGLPRGELEARESLEQLRWLEAGRRIRVLETAEGSVGIDTPEHYAQFLARERSRPTSSTGAPTGASTRARSQP